MLDPQVTISYFAVFDGHGGDSCPVFLKQNLHMQLVESFISPRDTKRLPLIQALNFEVNISEAIKEAYKVTDLMY